MPAVAAPDAHVELGGPGATERRSPFAASPVVGVRGLRTQQRILDAALQVFGEHGYDRAGLEQIAQVAGRSRASIYQYFSSKGDIFRTLSGQVARQLRASVEALEPVTPDAAGVASLRAWVGRYAHIHARYEPVFRAFAAASGSDAALAGGASLTAERNVDAFQSRLATDDLPPRYLRPMVQLLLTTTNHAVDLGALLRDADPDAFAREHVDAATATVLHRALFGLRPDVNAGQVAGPRPRRVPMSALLADAFQRVRRLEAEAELGDRRALAALLAVGDEVVVRSGYRGVRVADIVAAAGLSQGAFYRYFENAGEYARIIAVRALGDSSRSLVELPDLADRTSLRRWLAGYRSTQSAKGTVVNIWLEGVEDHLREDRAAVVDWGRRRMARLLAHRGFGDPDLEAVVLLAAVEAVRTRDDVDLDAATRLVARGFLGRDA